MDDRPLPASERGNGVLRFVLVHDTDRKGSRNHIGRLQHPNLELLSIHGTGFELLRRTSLPKANAIVLNGDLPDLPQHLFLRHAFERFPHVPLRVASAITPTPPDTNRP